MRLVILEEKQSIVARRSPLTKLREKEKARKEAEKAHKEQTEEGESGEGQKNNSTSETDKQTSPASTLSIRAKLWWAVVMATLGGTFVGIIEVHSGSKIWPLVIGLVMVIWMVSRTLGRSIHDPMLRLVMTTRQAMSQGRPVSVPDELLERKDHIGRLARLIKDLSVNAHQGSTAANHMRRTIDDRVDKATKQATKQLEKLASRDPLTELGNRRHLDDNFDTLVESCRTSGTDLICIAIDMDKFKTVNDTLGHATGDRLLTFLAHLIRGSIRHEDLAIRLGGDEFVVLMPNCEIERAGEVMEHIRSLFNQHARTVITSGIPVGISCGMSSLRRDGAKDGQELLHRADEYLYAAKEAGRGVTIGVQIDEDTPPPQQAHR